MFDDITQWTVLLFLNSSTPLETDKSSSYMNLILSLSLD